jgi:hypothetical protein
MRRTESKKLRDLVVSLAERSEEQDFFIWTAPLTSRIRALLNDLSAGPDEGNSREILRSLRDSLMDGGWESYRKASARAVAIKVLDLLKAVKVCAADADRAYELMACAGLSSAALLEIEEAWDDEHHGEEEAD